MKKGVNNNKFAESFPLIHSVCLFLLGGLLNPPETELPGHWSTHNRYDESTASGREKRQGPERVQKLGWWAGGWKPLNKPY